MTARSPLKNWYQILWTQTIVNDNPGSPTIGAPLDVLASSKFVPDFLGDIRL